MSTESPSFLQFWIFDFRFPIIEVRIRESNPKNLFHSFASRNRKSADLKSLDQPIRSGEHLRRNRDADLLCRLEIDHQLELHWLLDGQVSRLRAFEDLVHIGGQRAGDKSVPLGPYTIRPPASANRLVGYIAGSFVLAISATVLGGGNDGTVVYEESPGGADGSPPAARSPALRHDSPSLFVA